MGNFAFIPEGVVDNVIVPYLSNYDILQLKTTCKGVRMWHLWPNHWDTLSKAWHFGARLETYDHDRILTYDSEDEVLRTDSVAHKLLYTESEVMGSIYAWPDKSKRVTTRSEFRNEVSRYKAFIYSVIMRRLNDNMWGRRGSTLFKHILIQEKQIDQEGECLTEVVIKYDQKKKVHVDRRNAYLSGLRKQMYTDEEHSSISKRRLIYIAGDRFAQAVYDWQYPRDDDVSLSLSDGSLRIKANEVAYFIKDIWKSLLCNCDNRLCMGKELLRKEELVERMGILMPIAEATDTNFYPTLGAMEQKQRLVMKGQQKRDKNKKKKLEKKKQYGRLN